MKPEYLQSAEEVLCSQGSQRGGLTSQEAAARLEKHGPNRLQEAKKITNLQRFLQQLKDPMLLILMAAAAVSAVTSILSGEKLTEVIIILAVVLLNAVLGVVQESKAEAAIEALQTMTAATSKVLRDGKITVLHSADLVPGDVVLLEAGDAVPADGRLLESASLKIEEAALTGESVPVNKTAETISAEGDVPLGDRKNMCYMGSTVVYGRGSAVITATGMDTEMGKIAGVLARTEQEETPLQRKLTQLGKTLSYLVLAICVFIFVFDLLVEGDYSLEAILKTFMVAVSLAVAAIPEGLATVVTVVLSIGVTNMSKRGAVIRRLTAVETLGCTQVICSDKTGTLTQNKMTVVDHTGPQRLLATAMALCSDAAWTEEGAQGEPTEAALVNFAAEAGLKKPLLEEQQPRVAEAPFDSSRKMMSTVHQIDGGFIQYTKGAPDEVLRLCTCYIESGEMRPMTEEKRRAILLENKAMADRALRVLAAAQRSWGDKLPEDISPETLEQDLCFIGLAGMIDPVRPEVKDAIHQCRKAGIRPVMITGDHKDTAVAIAKELDILDSADQAITGSALNDLTDEELAEAVPRYSVYARVQPEHKVRIVSAWKKRGAITAMTGDGVNDAPSIKTADIGVGMGITGTDVTKNVADMVLSDDNFATIVGAVGEGRRIYDNIRKTIQFLLASNMSEVLGVFTATLLGFTLLGPVHLLFINLITDCFPALALGLEKAEPDVMDRPPRDSHDGIFAGGLGLDILYQGVLITVITLASYIIGHCVEVGYFEMPSGVSPHGMTMAFLTMSMCEIFHSFNMRFQRRSIFSGHSHNKVLWAAMLGSLLITTLVLEVGPIADAFGFTPVGWAEYGIALALAVLVIPVVELVKFFQRRAAKKKHK
ncbi:ATPase (plasmid) [Vescimonas fastidiosa]|uniref:P-type Ca(2+) transporter n=2 Tax=Vescimonas TaxID=2892396 RepID=A0A810PUD3_9FIRM|nr:cation-translocating P-type ATPase [Vescimonas fastidiosa]BCK79958.1 ATPase [Vescimonas fastidiosa]